MTVSVVSKRTGETQVFLEKIDVQNKQQGAAEAKRQMSYAESELSFRKESYEERSSFTAPARGKALAAEWQSNAKRELAIDKELEAERKAEEAKEAKEEAEEARREAEEERKEAEREKREEAADEAAERREEEAERKAEAAEAAAEAKEEAAERAAEQAEEAAEAREEAKEAAEEAAEEAREAQEEAREAAEDDAEFERMLRDDIADDLPAVDNGEDGFELDDEWDYDDDVGYDDPADPFVEDDDIYEDDSDDDWYTDTEGFEDDDLDEDFGDDWDDDNDDYIENGYDPENEYSADDYDSGDSGYEQNIAPENPESAEDDDDWYGDGDDTEAPVAKEEMSSATNAADTPKQVVKADSVPQDASAKTPTKGNFTPPPPAVINPQANELNKFSSYTYNIALYMMAPRAYISMIQNPMNFSDIPKTTIARSGGAGTDNPGDSPFNLDFFIDDLTIVNSAASPSKMAGNTNACDINFTITEPNGITLIERLIEQAKINLEEDMNYLQTPYCLELTFKGYDTEGKPSSELVKPKYFPIRIVDLKFSVEASGAQYKVSAMPFNQNVFKGITQTIPINLQVKATTVGDIFSNGGRTFKTIKVADNSQDATDEDFIEKTIESTDTQTLATALNDFEISKTKPRTVTTKDAKTKKDVSTVVPPDAELANQYEFMVADVIAKAALQKSQFDAQNTPANTSKLYKHFGSAAKGKVDMDTTKGLFRINAGTGLVNLINYVLVGSTYVEKNILDDLDANAEKSSEAGKPINWFRIKPKIIDFVGWDKKQGSYKFKIRYDILPSQIYYHDFPFAPKSKPKGKGIHKIYDYFFTGRNTEVNSFKLDFDTAYYQAQTIGTGSKSDKLAASDGVGAPQTQNVPQSTEGNAISTAGTDKEKKAKDLFSTIMNDGPDLIDLKLDIVGDPGYLPTGDGFWQDKELAGDMYTGAFLPDGTINYDMSPPYVQVNLLTPVDYDTQTGLMDPNKQRKFGSSKFSGVYQVTEVKSSFAGGMFTQQLSGFRTRTQPLADGKVGRDQETVKYEEVTADRATSQQPAGLGFINSFQKDFSVKGVLRQLTSSTSSVFDSIGNLNAIDTVENTLDDIQNSETFQQFSEAAEDSFRDFTDVIETQYNNFTNNNTDDVLIGDDF